MLVVGAERRAEVDREGPQGGIKPHVDGPGPWVQERRPWVSTLEAPRQSSLASASTATPAQAAVAARRSPPSCCQCRKRGRGAGGRRGEENRGRCHVELGQV
ncbi:hypothetical protein GUJ93_ZPchr0013g35260 [Zizania palustris]|uniref:Uncharacterized protein n=1 Tax=Zizania palustris TaxID=103762 RepID=A0A8J5X5T3_ZIZPA|nr:hypothetical protein GUJ93_ZPchr0013g35260 [Zizania palustris]